MTKSNGINKEERKNSKSEMGELSDFVDLTAEIQEIEEIGDQSDQTDKVHFKKIEARIVTEYDQIKQWKLPIPWEITEIEPELHFYISSKPCIPYKISYRENVEGTLKEIESAGYFDKKQTSRLIFITHGFENDITTPWLPQMKDEILQVDPKALVVLLGWGGGANINVLKYAQAAANTQTVAKWFQEYLKGFKSISKDLYIYGIGHSLGAHLLGLAGRFSGCFDRLSGLDPAGPSFEKVNQENRLCKTDAKLVDVIHTDGYDTVFDPSDWFAPVNHYGTLIPLGNIDFYPNFGYRQPGISHFEIAGSHHRSISLFLWSIGNAGRFVSNAILDGSPAFEKPVTQVKYISERVEMGYHFNQGCGVDCGLFYLETAGSVPWIDPQIQFDESSNSSSECQGWGWNWPMKGCIIS